MALPQLDHSVNELVEERIVSQEEIVRYYCPPNPTAAAATLRRTIKHHSEITRAAVLPLVIFLLPPITASPIISRIMIQMLKTSSEESNALSTGEESSARRNARFVGERPAGFRRSRSARLWGSRTINDAIASIVVTRPIEQYVQANTDRIFLYVVWACIKSIPR